MIAALLTALPALSEQAKPAPNEVPQYPAEAFFKTTSYVPVSSEGHAFSPDGRHVLVGSDETGVYNVRAFDLASGKSTALTASTSFHELNVTIPLNET